MSTARIVVGAAGLLGCAVTTCLRSYPGTLLAVDRAGPTGGRVAQSNAAPVVVLDATTAAFADLLAQFLAGCSRAELYHTAGAVPPLRRFDDTTAEEFAAAVEENLTATYLVLHRFARVTGQLDVPASAVVVTSVGAHRAHRYLVGYDAAKAGVESVVRSLAVEHGGRLSPRTIALDQLPSRHPQRPTVRCSPPWSGSCRDSATPTSTRSRGPSPCSAIPASTPRPGRP